MLKTRIAKGKEKLSFFIFHRLSRGLLCQNGAHLIELVIDENLYTPVSTILIVEVLHEDHGIGHIRITVRIRATGEHPTIGKTDSSVKIAALELVPYLRCRSNSPAFKSREVRCIDRKGNRGYQQQGD